MDTMRSLDQYMTMEYTIKHLNKIDKNSKKQLMNIYTLWVNYKNKRRTKVIRMVQFKMNKVNNYEKFKTKFITLINYSNHFN